MLLKFFMKLRKLKNYLLWLMNEMKLMRWVYYYIRKYILAYYPVEMLIIFYICRVILLYLKYVR